MKNVCRKEIPDPTLGAQALNLLNTLQMDSNILCKAANQARGLAIDAIHKAGLGHLGLPLGCAEMGAALFSESLSFNPDQPRWINRDRFVLVVVLEHPVVCSARI